MTSRSCMGQPWQQMSIHLPDTGMNRDYLAKSLFDETEGLYEVYLWDGTNMYTDRATSEQIADKTRTLNKNIETSVQNIVKWLKEGFENAKLLKTMDEVSNDDFQMEHQLRMKWKLAVGPMFSWSFSLSPCPTSDAYTHVTEPLLLMVVEMQKRQERLINLIDKKDAQIQDYKQQGCQLTRSRLDTQPFNRAQFEQLSDSHDTFISACAKSEFPYAFDTLDSTQKLYSKTMEHTGLKRNKNKHMTPMVVLNDGQTNGAMHSTESTDATAPAVASQQESTSPTKLAEQQRREALKRRLEQDAAKESKKKKKKIKL